MSIAVYGNASCMPCRTTKKWLTSRGVDYQYLDISRDPQALETITELGYSSVPVIVVDDGASHWQGYQPDRLETLL